jgi:hypothetical protein
MGSLRKQVKFHSIISITLLFACSLIFLSSCTNEDHTKKFLGKWKTDSHRDYAFRLEITKSGKNFIIEYSGLPSKLSEADIESEGTIIGTYDNVKDKLVLKAYENLEAIYDDNKQQLIVEKWGAFVKTN